MENIDIELRIQNTRFIIENIFTRYALHKCIKILKSEQFAKKQLKNSLLEITAIVFWNDLYYLNFYDKTIAELKSRLDTVKSSYECEDDIDEKYQYKQQLDWIQSEIKAQIDNIELTNEFRRLMLVAIPDIETLWEQKLVEHNALQEKCEAENLEREVMRAEIRKNKLNAIQKSDSTPPPKTFAGLLRDLSDTQLDNLFVFLTAENKAYPKPRFIDTTTDRDSFNHIFGSREIKKPIVPIEWKANKQFLIDLLTGLQKELKSNKQNPDTLELSNDIERQKKKYFIDSKTKQGLKLPNNNNRLKDRPEYKAISKFLATI